MLNVFEELGETSRRLILAELRSGPKSVCDLVESTGLKQPNVSSHLARLRLKDIVRCEKVGRHVYYSLSTPDVAAIVHSAFAPSSCPCLHLDMGQLAEAYARAAIEGDEAACSEVMDAAYRARMSMVDIYQDILSPAMCLIGHWYKSEEIDECQEHLASNITERMMARTVQITGPCRRHDKTAILGCAPDSWHVIGLRMIGDYLRYCGWRTLYLGANVPTQSFCSAAKQHRPDLVLLSCSCNQALETTLATIASLGSCPHRTFLIGVGGQCVSRDPERFLAAGADFTARDLRQFAYELLPDLEGRGCGCGPVR